MNVNVLLLLLCFCAGQAFAVDPELEKLQKSYDEATKRALAPIQATYQKELQKLMEQHTRAGKLDAAVETKAELEKFGQKQTQLATSKSITDEAALRKKLTSGKFVFFFAPPRSKLMTFGRSGKIEEGATEQEHKWKLEGNELLIHNQEGKLSHALDYAPATDSFQTGARPSLWMSRKPYLENAKQ